MVLKMIYFLSPSVFLRWEVVSIILAEIIN